jgi:hypothetical protein
MPRKTVTIDPYNLPGPAGDTERPQGDAWLLPDDGIIDPVAVGIAASGERRVCLTAPERHAAAVLILARGGTTAVIAERLCMTDRAARALAYTIRHGYTRAATDRQAVA